MYYIAKSKNNDALIFYDENEVKKYNIDYFETETIPGGQGLLKTDLKSLWWENAKSQQPISEENITLDMLADHEYRLSIMELTETTNESLEG